MNKELLEELRALTEEQMYNALYVDALTGVLNRAAFMTKPRNPVAIVDLDSLKFTNDTLGHRQGDALLQALATLLAQRFGDCNVYRIGGDEFAVVGESRMELLSRLSGLRRVFPGFSFGIGKTVPEADANMLRNKAKREELGLRAKRGECPPWDFQHSVITGVPS